MLKLLTGVLLMLLLGGARISSAEPRKTVIHLDAVIRLKSGLRLRDAVIVMAPGMERSPLAWGPDGLSNIVLENLEITGAGSHHEGYAVCVGDYGCRARSRRDE